MNNFIILGDKDNLFIGCGDGKFLHVKRPILRNWSWNVHNDMIQVSTWGSDVVKFLPDRMTFDIDLSLTGDGCELTSDDPQKKILESYTVLDLMRAVNRKLK